MYRGQKPCGWFAHLPTKMMKHRVYRDVHTIQSGWQIDLYHHHTYDHLQPR